MSKRSNYVNYCSGDQETCDNQYQVHVTVTRSIYIRVTKHTVADIRAMGLWRTLTKKNVESLSHYLVH